MPSITSPKSPIPGPLRGAEIGSFAHNTVVVRLPDIVRRVLAENAFPPAIERALQDLIDEIPHQPVRSLTDRSAPDAAAWERYIAVYPQHDWLEVAWFFAEYYLYRRILEATGYFQAGAGQWLDPYAYQKKQGLETTRDAIRALGGRLNNWLQQGQWNPANLRALLLFSLWGNRADLSLWPADNSQAVDASSHLQRDDYILINQSQAVVEHLTANTADDARVDFIIDNAGFELVTDLCLADYLLSTQIASAVYFNLKVHPTFVSDAMAKDVHDTISFLGNDLNGDVRDLAGRLRSHLEVGRLRLRADWFWTSPLSGWEMSSLLREQMEGAKLVISKGDANYRRLLGDRHWPFSTPFADIVAYFPAPLLALRTLKSEIICGLDPSRPPELDPMDPHWLTNGRWGVIQFRS